MQNNFEVNYDKTINLIEKYFKNKKIKVDIFVGESEETEFDNDTKDSFYLGIRIRTQGLYKFVENNIIPSEIKESLSKEDIKNITHSFAGGDIKPLTVYLETPEKTLNKLDDFVNKYLIKKGS